MDKKRYSIRINSGMIMGALLLLAIFLRLPRLNQSLWFDEVWYSTHVGIGSLIDLLRGFVYDKAAPFYRIFMFFWINLFSDSEISVRIPSLFCGIFSLVFTYFIALRLTDKKTALLASFLLCVSPVHIWYSQEATPYSMALFLLLFSVFSYYKLRENSSKRLTWYCLYFISLFLAIFTHWFCFFYLIAISILCLFQIDNVKRNILKLNLGIFLCVTLFLILKAIFGKILTGEGFLRLFTIFELWMLFFNWFSFGNSIWSVNPYYNIEALSRPVLLSVQILFFLIFARGLIVNWKNNPKIIKFDLFIFIMLLPAAIMGLSAIGFRHLYIERYLFILLPFFYTVLSYGMFSFGNPLVRKVFIGVVIALFILALACYFLKPGEWTVYKQNPDWNSGALFLENDIGDSNAPIFVSTSARVSPLRYYMKKIERVSSKKVFLKVFFFSDCSDGLYKEISKVAFERVYLINETVWTNNFEDYLRKFKTNNSFKLLKTETFKGLEIYKFERTNQSANY